MTIFKDCKNIHVCRYGHMCIHLKTQTTPCKSCCNKARNPVDLSKSQPISPTNEKNHWHRKLKYVSAQTQEKN